MVSDFNAIYIVAVLWYIEGVGKQRRVGILNCLQQEIDFLVVQVCEGKGLKGP